MAIQEALSQPPPAAEVPVVPEAAPGAETVHALGRDALLRALLEVGQTGEIASGNYESLVSPINPDDPDSEKLIDAYRLGPDGRDAIVHILAGDAVVNPETGEIIELGGYHHEMSALSEDTYIDHDAIAERAGRKGWKEFKRHPYEPYKTRTVVRGHKKESSSVMFPGEYDALAVLKTIKVARDTRKPENDRDGYTEDTKVADVDAIMLDGVTTYKLRIVMDRDTDQIITAMPLANRGRLMKDLTRESTREHLGVADGKGETR